MEQRIRLSQSGHCIMIARASLKTCLGVHRRLGILTGVRGAISLRNPGSKHCSIFKMERRDGFALFF